MKKLADIRDFLINHPIQVDADNLLTFAEKGSVQHHFDPDDQSFSLSYDANIILTDFVGDFNILLFVILEWLQDKQPNLKRDAVDFHVDILDHKRSDLSLTFNLSEDINATEFAEGSDLTSMDEPNIHTIGLQFGPSGTPLPYPTDPPDEPASLGSEIDDNTTSLGAVYSSQKVEDRLGEIIGNPNIDLVVLFDNLISQGI